MSDRKGRPWRRARAYWSQRLPVGCSRCGGPVEAWQEWDLDHLVSVANGGDSSPENLWPAHRGCNRAAGGSLGRARTGAADLAVTRSLAPPGGWPGPSRDWWPGVPKGRRGYPVGDKRNAL